MKRQPAAVLSEAPTPRKGLLRWALPLSILGHGAAAAAGLWLGGSQPAPLPAMVTVEVVAEPEARPAAGVAMAQSTSDARDQKAAAMPHPPGRTHEVDTGEPAASAESDAGPEEAPRRMPAPPPPRPAAPDRPAEEVPVEPELSRNMEEQEEETVTELPDATPSAGGTVQQASVPSEGASSPPRYELGSGGNPVPEYPWKARRAGWEGRVVLRVNVTSDGMVSEARVADSSGYSPLDQAALETIRRWRFEPALRGGVPVAGEVRVPITFRLVN